MRDLRSRNTVVLWACLAVACSGDDAPVRGPVTGGAAAPAGGTVSSAPVGGAAPGTGQVTNVGPLQGGGPAPGAPAANGGTPAAAPSGGVVASAPAAGGGVAPPPPSGDAKPSAGCGNASPPASGNMKIDVDGLMRDYIVKLPANYDPQHPYRLIFAWHGLGGSAMQVAGGFGGGYYGLAQRSMNSAIFIAGQGLPANGATSAAGAPAAPPTMAATGASGAQAAVAAIAAAGGAGWPNTGGRDVAFVRKLVEWANTNYCVDDARIFSVGMSYGGIMSNTLGCQMGDVFRAIAPMSGSGPSTFRGNQCVGQVAAWLSHGNMDDVVSFMSGQASRDHWVMTNHCSAMTEPVAPDPCVAYQGCDAGFPVHWCEFSGGHTVPSFSGDAIWKFFSSF